MYRINSAAHKPANITTHAIPEVII